MWLGLCHPRGRICERGGVCGPFHVADKRRRYAEHASSVLVLGVFITVVLDTVCGTDTILYCVWRSLWDGVLCVGFPLWCWILCVALTQSCVAYGDHYLRICCLCTIIV